MFRSHWLLSLVCSALVPAALAVEATTTPQPPPALTEQAPVVAEPKYPAAAQTLKNLEYSKVGEKSLLLDLYLPQNVDKKPLPTILWIHGGGWTGGSKEHCPVKFLVQSGYAVASINYRFSTEAIFPAQIHDCKAAMRWLRAHATDYILDSDHIGASGDSAGGHLSALMGTSGDVKDLEGTTGNEKFSSRVQCVCDWFGPTDFANYGKDLYGDDEIKKTIAMAAPNPIKKLFGGTEKWEVGSPITYVTKDDPPFMLLHGDADPLVPLEQSKRLEKSLKDIGVEAKLVVVKGGAHGGAAYTKPEIQKEIKEFFDHYLKPAK